MSLTDDFLSIENKHKLNSIKIDGFTPWVYMRWSLFHEITCPLYRFESKGLRRFTYALRKYISCVRMLTRRSNPPRNVDILFLPCPRRVFLNGIYECIFTDALADIFTNSVTLEPLYDFSHQSPVMSKNLVYVDKIVLRSHISAACAKYSPTRKYASIRDRIKSLFGEALEELSVKSGCDFDIDIFSRRAAKQYFVYKSRYNGYMKFMEKASPTLIVEVWYCNMDTMIINEIAKNMRIPTAELQHGTIDDDHLAYNFPQGEAIPQFPDKLLLFGEYWKVKAAYPLSADALIPVGYPYFEQQINKYRGGQDCLNSYKTTTKNQEYIENVPARSRNKTLVFLSQPIISARCKYDKLALDVHERLSKTGWSVVFRYHPSEYSDWEQRYPKLVDSSIKVADRTLSLYEVFSTASAVVGLNSTTLFEAIGFELPIFIYDITGASQMADLLVMGYAQLFTDADDLCTKLEELSKLSNARGLYSKLESSDCTDTRSKIEIWKSNAQENMVTELQKLLDSNPRMV